MNSKYLIFPFILLFVITGLFGQVDSKELQNIINKEIIFENYTGSYEYRESTFSIQGIGRRLANGLKNSGTNRFQYFSKYSIIHCVDESEDGKLNADILSIDEDAKVEHIRNVRLILSSYLSSQYGYTRRDADTLAYFITIYNAVYRQDVEYFNSKFHKIVIDHITKENAGLSLKYYEWPGKSKILIPLTGNPKKGNISSLNTTELSHKAIIEASKEEENKSLKQRKELTKIKEKEIRQQEKKLKTAQKSIDQKTSEIVRNEKQLAMQRQDLQNREKNLLQKQLELRRKREKIKLLPEGAEKEKALDELRKEEEALEKEKRELEEFQKELLEKEREASTQKDNINKETEKKEKQERAISNKKEEIIQDKKGIMEDEALKNMGKDSKSSAEQLQQQIAALEMKKELLEEKENQLKNNKPDPRIFAGKFYYLKVKEYLNGGHYNNQLSVIDGKTRRLVKNSSFTNICGKNYYVFKEGVVVIGHKEEKSDSHHLVLLDSKTLEIKKMGTDDIFQRTLIEIKDNFIYAVIKGETNYHLGKFNLELELIAKSEIAIFNDTFLTFYEDNIYLNDNNREILILDKTTLEKLEIVIE